MKNDKVPKNVLNERLNKEFDTVQLSKETLEFVEKSREEFLNKIRDPKNLIDENKFNGVYCGPTKDVK